MVTIRTSWTTNLNQNDFDYYYVGVGIASQGNILWDSSAVPGLGTVSKWSPSSFISASAILLRSLAQGQTISRDNNFFVAVQAYKNAGGYGMFDDLRVAETEGPLFSIP